MRFMAFYMGKGATWQLFTAKNKTAAKVEAKRIATLNDWRLMDCFEYTAEKRAQLEHDRKGAIADCFSLGVTADPSYFKEYPE